MTPTAPVLADKVAQTALAVTGVVGLHSGEGGTYLPGRTVEGIRIGSAVTEVHLVVGLHAPLTSIAAAVRAAVAPVVGTKVDVYIDDIWTL